MTEDAAHELPVRAVRIRGGTVDPLAPWDAVDTEPASGLVLAELVGGGDADATQVVDATAEALDAWRSVTSSQRANALRRVAADLRSEPNAEELATLVTRETGKRLPESRAEVALATAFFEWYADAISTAAGEVWKAVPGHRHEVWHQSLGVVAVITPWNFPVSIPARKIAPALAAGCTVAFKPSEIAPLSSLRLAEIVEHSVPPGVINTMLGSSKVVAASWLSDKRVRGLTFTGSTVVGQALARAAADNLVRCVLELGGTAPFVVLGDADIADAIRILAIAKYRNNGQSCIAANELWIPRELVDDYVAAISTINDSLVLGDPLDELTSLGPVALASDPDRLATLVDDAEMRGARVIRSTVPVPATGQFARPAICLDPPIGARIRSEEIFGPPLVVRGYVDLDEVIASVRAAPHGLGGYVCGGDASRAALVARALDVGIVGVNTATPNTPQIPFGGRRGSGLGYEGGRLGLAEFLTSQSIAIAES